MYFVKRSFLEGPYMLYHTADVSAKLNAIASSRFVLQVLKSGSYVLHILTRSSSVQRDGRSKGWP